MTGVVLRIAQKNTTSDSTISLVFKGGGGSFAGWILIDQGKKDEVVARKILGEVRREHRSEYGPSF